MKAAHFAFALVLLALVAGPVGGTTTCPEDVKCPVCGKAFTVEVVMSTNNAGGPDYDLCSHAAGKEPRLLRIWTCPGCLYSRWGSEFREAVPAELAKRVREELESVVPLPEGVSRDRLPVRVKFRLALRVAEWRGDSEKDRALLALTGARAMRSVSVPVDDVPEEIRSAAAAVAADGLEGLRRCRQALEAARLLLERAGAPEVTPAAAAGDVVLAGAVLRFRGEDADLLPRLAAIAEDDSLPERVREAAAILVENAGQEARFRDAYLQLETSALDRAEDGEETAIRRYIRADSLRRAGRVEEAVAGYRSAMTREGAPSWLVPLATEVLDRLGGEGLSEEELSAVKREARERALARLLDPETADDAYRELRSVCDPEAIPGIVAALGHEDATVRGKAALTLKFYDDPGAEAVDALVRILEDDPEPYPREKAAYALEQIASPRSRSAFERILEEGRPDEFVESAVESLGKAGDTSTVPLLLARREEHAREVDIALARLVNREFASAAAFDSWWSEHRDRSRAELVLDGFHEAGYEIEDLDSEAAVAALLDALTDARDPIRYNAFRLLRERTGLAIGRDAFDSPYDSPRDEAERMRAALRFRRALE